MAEKKQQPNPSATAIAEGQPVSDPKERYYLFDWASSKVATGLNLARSYGLDLRSDGPLSNCRLYLIFWGSCTPDEEAQLRDL